MRSIASFLTSKNFVPVVFLCGALVLMQAGICTGEEHITVPAKVTIEKGVSVSKTEDLDFGTVKLGVGAKSFTIQCANKNDVAHAAASGSGTSLIMNPGFTTRSGAVTISAPLNMEVPFSVGFTIMDPTLGVGSGGVTLSAVNDNSRPNASTNDAKKASGEASTTICVGGKLTVNAASAIPPGSYSTDIDVSITF